eukprot:TRINITY_DN7436_c0_g1_i2.p1 TRINITY_DN7436_c0_g1~~TRINITY_DN7436_c0_g1_i2.p1  ORF type:complete len:258 (-),score=71.14 TRINITY_DN7436_c0_g1_i2:92-838(-)
MIRRPPRSTHCISSAASDVYKRQLLRKITVQRRPQDVWKWVSEYRRTGSLAKANEAHKALLKFQEFCFAKGRELTVATLDFSGLYAKLIKESTVLDEDEKLLEGSEDLADMNNLIELRGNVNYMRCSDDCCYSLYYTPSDLQTVPKCPQCKAAMRPHILLFDEGDNEMHYKSVTAIKKAARADCMIVIGVGLGSQLTNCLIQEHVDEGKLLVEMNTEKTIKEEKKNVLHIEESCERSVPKLLSEVMSI